MSKMLEYSLAEKFGFTVESPGYEDISRKARAVFSKTYSDESHNPYLVELVVDKEGRILTQRYYRLYQESDGSIISMELSRLPRTVQAHLQSDISNLL